MSTDIRPIHEEEAAFADRAARLISNVLHPLLLWNGTVCGIVLLTTYSLRALLIPAALLMTSLVSAFTALRLPANCGFGLLSTTPNQGDRQKPRFFLPLLLGLILAFSTCYALGAPRSVQIYCGITLGVVAVSVGFSRWVRISGHVAAITGTSLMATIFLGGAGLPAIAFIAMVAWARLRLHLHTLSEIVAGAVIGALASATFYLLTN